MYLDTKPGYRPRPAEGKKSASSCSSERKAPATVSHNIPNCTRFHTAGHPAPYVGDAVDYYAALADAHDSLLLESAEIGAPSAHQSFLLTRAALRVTCRGRDVVACARTATGHVMLEQLCENEKLGQCVTARGDDEAVFCCREEEASAPAGILRHLSCQNGYASPGGTLPYIGGGFAFDYVEQFADLPDVAARPNTFPD